MSSLAYNAILKYVVIGNALPNRLQRYDKKCIYASKASIFLQENKSGKKSVMHWCNDATFIKNSRPRPREFYKNNGTDASMHH